tara:strand:+ start:107 stop:739 length:633 start_codon:yes stop_codon:yes gene_type:complete
MKPLKSFHRIAFALFIILCIVSVNSCQTDAIEPEAFLIENPVAINLFKSQVNKEIPKLRERINVLNYSEYSANLENVNTDFAELEELMSPSLTFLNSVGFSNEDLTSEFGSLYDPNIIVLAMSALVSLEASKESQKGSVAPDGNSFMKCLGSASGVTGIWQMATGAAAVSRSAILKAVGKFAKRSLGWIGAALFMGEFVQCYWGNNSSFD